MSGKRSKVIRKMAEQGLEKFYKAAPKLDTPTARKRVFPRAVKLLKKQMRAPVLGVKYRITSRRERFLWQLKKDERLQHASAA